MYKYIDYAIEERLRSTKAALSIIAELAGKTGNEETVAKLNNCVKFELAVRYAYDALKLQSWRGERVSYQRS
jgi:hypothetical protein